MTVETNPTTISDLNAAWPLAIDPRFEGAAHIRNIKSVLQDTFPNLKGSVSVSDTALNAITSQFSSDGKTFSPGVAYVVPALPDATQNYSLGVKDADSRYLSRSVQMGEADSPGISLFYSGGSKGPWFVSSPWTGQLATQNDLNTAAQTASSGVSIGQAAQKQADSALSAANAAQSSANSGIAQAQTAQATANGAQSGVTGLGTSKLDATDGTATRLSISYGSVSAKFQDDGNFVIYAGSMTVFSVSSSGISWNGHNFVFEDTNVLPAGQRIEAFVVSTTDGSRVNFPTGFSSADDIVLQLTCQRSTGRVVIASWDAIDSGGFTIGMQREDTNGASQQTTAWSVHVTATGNS